MDLYHFTWILAALSITGSLGQYPTVTLLSTYALIYSYGLAKHGYKEIKRRRKIDQDRVQIEPIDV